MQLIEPDLEHLSAYVAALERGWSPDTLRPQAAGEELAAIREDAAAFVARQIDREARGGPVTLPDGSQVPRLPGYRLWIWDDDFCGVINFRWQAGTAKLPAHVLGHLGYTVVPWKRGRGIATRALGVMRGRVRVEGLPYIDMTADPDNVASQKVITANGGFLVERFRKGPEYGHSESLRYRWYTGAPHPVQLETTRTRLRQWRDEDLEPFAGLNADPVAREHFPGLATREESAEFLARARDAIALRGWGLWALERREDRRFMGFVGLNPVRESFPFAPAIEAGWRLLPTYWGQGYATEAARAALRFGLETLALPEIVSYTATTNARSVAVMQRLGMSEAEPFEHPEIAAGHRLRPHRLFRIGAGV